MMTQQAKLNGIKHPYIKSLYLEKDSIAQKPQDILVIETDIDLSETEFNAKDERLVELLIDLNELQMLAEQKIGAFDRIDIRSY